MILDTLFVSSFRNLEQDGLSFAGRFNIFYGDNAQGKTNLLEAIFLLGTLKSFRQARSAELIRHGSDGALVRGSVVRDGSNREITLVLERHAKRVLVDGKAATRLSDFFGALNTVAFSPDELSMVRGLPEQRRRFLDRAIFSGDAGYLRCYHDYGKVLKNRNALLRRGETTCLDVWSERLADTGSALIARRLAYVGAIAPMLTDFYGTIAGCRENADLSLITVPGAETVTREGVRGLLLEGLARRADEEVRRGTTLVGPHRDDLLFRIDGRELKSHGSQGQQRSFVLALKMAEIEHLRCNFGSPPVLLLDDVTSELDETRRRNMLAFLDEREMQVFITTTSLATVRPGERADHRFFRVEAGRVFHERDA